MTKSKANATSFKKGRRKSGGRKRGVPNRRSSVLWEATFLAAETVGSDDAGTDGLTGYLTTVARENRAVFCSLLGRAMPLQLETDPLAHTKIEYPSVVEIREKLIKRGVPPEIIRIIFSEPLELTDETDENTDEQ